MHYGVLLNDRPNYWNTYNDYYAIIITHIISYQIKNQLI